MKAELIVALDVPNSSQVPAILSKLPEEISWFKVGLELFCAEGPVALSALKEQNRNIFLDLKLHDIPRTVANSVQSIGQLGVNLVTVHASGGRAMLKAAAEAAAELGANRPKLVAVTMLTSLDQADLGDLGTDRTPADHVMALADMALSSGIDGLVCSVWEAKVLRERFGPEPILITPGIRLPTNDVGDQKRVATPETAVEQGASHLVVGRPILQADDPMRAATTMLDALR